MTRKRRAMPYRLERFTVAVMLLAVLMLNALLFSAGWILGATQGPAIMNGLRAANDPLPRARVSPPARTPSVRTSRATEGRRPLETIASAPFVIPRWAGPPAEAAPPEPPPILIASRETTARYLPRNYASLIEEAAYRESVPSYLVAAVARVESNFDARAVSDKGALGLMQVMPDTAKRFGFDATRLHDPVHNVAAGATYLRWLLDRYDGDLDRVLAAYNAGEGAVDKYNGIPPYRETQDFVKRVRAVMEKGGVRTGTAA